MGPRSVTNQIRRQALEKFGDILDTRAGQSEAMRSASALTRYGETTFRVITGREKLSGLRGSKPINEFSKLVIARDFWRQALDPQCLAGARMSTGVRAVLLSSPRVLETFWTRPKTAVRQLLQRAGIHSVDFPR